MESEQLANLIHASRYAAGIIILFEMRNDRALDNDAGHRVGEDAFKAISPLDPYLAFTGRDDQQRSIIFALLSDATCTPKPLAIVRDILTLKIGQTGHDDMTSTLLLHSLALGPP